LRGTTAYLAATMPRVLTVGMEDDMVAYWVARSKVNNPDEYKKYTDRNSREHLRPSAR